MRTSSAVTRPAAIAAWALARLSNRPRSTSRRSMRTWVAMGLQWVKMRATEPVGAGGVRVPEQVTVLCCYFQSAHREPTRSGAGPHGRKGWIMARKYSRSASKDVERVMRKRKRGKLKSGQRKKGHKPQTGYRHRPFRGAQERKESPAQEHRPQSADEAGETIGSIRARASWPRHADSGRAPRTPW